MDEGGSRARLFVGKFHVALLFERDAAVEDDDGSPFTTDAIHVLSVIVPQP